MPAGALHYATAADQAEAVARREISVPELVELHLARIERLDPRLNAFRVVLADRAREEAAAVQRRVDAGEQGPLLGVPVAVKDNMDVAGEVTGHGTGAVRQPAQRDGEVVRRLRAAGAVIVGKTNLPELAMWGHFTESRTWGETRNPWDPARTPGGSSGGSAAAVAAGLAAVAAGSDGGASIRVPAALCGLFGIKPQRGRVSLDPDPEHWLGLTHFGPLARSVQDAALFLDAVTGPAEGDADVPPAPDRSFVEAARSEPRRLRVAVSLKTILPTKPGPAQRAAVRETADLLASLGHEVVERDPDYPELRPVIVPRYLRGIYLDAQRLEDPGALERRTRGMIRLGRRMGRLAERGRAKEAGVAGRINAIFADHDLLLTPVTASAPPPVGRDAGRGPLRTFLGATDWVCYTPIWNYTGQPAARSGWTRTGCPRPCRSSRRPTTRPPCSRWPPHSRPPAPGPIATRRWPTERRSSWH
jgi:amidase